MGEQKKYMIEIDIVTFHSLVTKEKDQDNLVKT